MTSMMYLTYANRDCSPECSACDHNWDGRSPGVQQIQQIQQMQQIQQIQQIQQVHAGFRPEDSAYIVVNV